MPRSSESGAPVTGLVRGDPDEPHVRFELAIELAVPRARVHGALSALEGFAAMHPLIESIEPLPPEPARPHARRYRVVDRIPVGPFRLRTVYTAELEALAPDRIRGEAWQSPGVHLLTTYQLDETMAGHTRLRESVELRAPLGLRRLVASQARAAHRTTLERLKRLLESPSPPPAT